MSTKADQVQLRRAIAEKWSDEDDHSNYRYNVERCANGKRVYLLRPTWLNNGFYFQVNVEGLVKVVKLGKVRRLKVAALIAVETSRRRVQSPLHRS